MPEHLDGFGGEPLDLIAVAEVGDEVPDLPAEALHDLRRRGGQLGLVAARDDDVGAGLGEGARQRFAEAAASAGDEGHASRQIEQAADLGQRALSHSSILRRSRPPGVTMPSIVKSRIRRDP